MQKFFTSRAGQPLLLVFLLLMVSRLSIAQSPTFLPNWWKPNGKVNSVLIDGNTVYLGGYFSYLGPKEANTAYVDLNTGTANSSWVNPDQVVYAVVSDGAGGYIVGGQFSQVDGQPRANIARINSDGTLNAWNPGVTSWGRVWSMERVGTTLYVAGNFTDAAGQPRNNLASIDINTGAATAWNPNASGEVNKILIDGTTAYVCGQFTNLAGQSRNRIGAVDVSTGSATSFNPNANAMVWTLAKSGSTVYAGGFFSTIGGQSRSYLAALDATTGLATAWNPNANNGIMSITVNGSTVYVGGFFGTIGGQNRNYLAALDATTGLATAWAPNPEQQVYSIVIDGGTMYVGGSFYTMAGNTRRSFAAFDVATGNLLPSTANADQTIYAIVPNGTNVFLGGQFSSIGGAACNNLAALDATTGQAIAWNARTDYEVKKLAKSGNTMYLCGDFSSINGQPRNYLGAVHATTGAILPWNPNPNSQIFDIVADGSLVYACGYFSSIGGQGLSYLAALEATTGNAIVWNPNPDSEVRSMAAHGGLLYVSGYFSNIGGASRNFIAAIDASGNATAWDPSPDSYVMALDIDGNNLYAGGYFNYIAGEPRNYLAGFDLTTGNLTAFDPSPNSSPEYLSAGNGKVYTSGYFSTIGGQSRNYFAELDGTTGLATAFDAITGYEVFDVAANASYLVAGGDYSMYVNGNQNSYFAPFAQPAPPVKTWNGSLSTAWNLAGNWTPSGIPTATDDVVIPDLANDPAIGFIPGSVRDLTIADGVTISVNNGIALYVNGQLNAGTGTGSTIAGLGGIMELNGSDPQQINGKLTVRTLRINNSSMGGVNILGTLNLTTGLVMIDGDVNAMSGTVTLKSNASTSAYLDNFTSPTAGTYFGDLTVERYVGNTANGYRNISAPVNTTVGDLADDISIIGQDGVNCWYSYSPYPNVQVYDEAANNGLSTPTGNYYTGWISKTGAGNAMSAMKGFAIRTYNGAPYTIDLTGAPYSGSKSIDITKTASATASQDGWNFIGNPFPSPISWTGTEANNPGATTGSYYVFNTTGEYTGNWGSFNGVTGTNGATNNIAIMQGFFVRSVDPLNYVEANNSSRVASATAPFFKSYSVQPNEIRLSLHDQTNSDEIVAYTDGAATWSEDLGKDAVKIPAGSTVYMSYKQLGKEYAINVIDEITETTELPLVLWATDTGTYTFEATELNVDGYITYLKDAELNTLTDLTTTPSVTLQLNGQQAYEGRYSIVFETVEVEEPSGITNISEGGIKIYSHKNIAVVERPTDEKATITISNLIGQTIKEVVTDSKRTEITLDNTNAWYAIVKVKEANAIRSQKVMIK